MKRYGPAAPLDDDPQWYMDAVVYEVHVRSFQDSTGDGVGDFGGLRERLDYLQDLGVTALWLLPFYPSPLRDDGYDIADYTGVHPPYGTLSDVVALLSEAHRRGIRVITEMVVNHTSDRHPWFQRARRARPGSRARDVYVWSDSADRYRDARVIFKDFESSNWTWDPVAGAYYWHRFYAHQPDLNFESPWVRAAVLKAVDFWLSRGVDGLRLDAVPYLYERDGTTCENLPETHAFLRDLRRHVDEKFRSRVLLAEANQWPEDSAAYFGAGDEAHMAFHFPLMPRLFMALRMEERFPVVDILRQTPSIPPTCQWALFLRNHDELTLEMVTDEERDYMYRTYAQDQQARVNLGIRRRLAPLLGNSRRKMELVHALLFSLPGTPVLYYGDEIGMGDNIYLGDRNAVRTPMQWSSDRNGGFSTANPQRLYLPLIVDPEFHYAAVNVEAQQANPQSLLWWTRRLIALRKKHRAFGRGRIEFLHPENRRVLAFLRRHESEVLLVVANLSRFVQHVSLDLSAHRGTTPVELFGGTPFPPIESAPMFLTLGPHAFYWFALEAPKPHSVAGSTEPPRIGAIEDWPGALLEEGRARLEAALPEVLRRRPWFVRRPRTLRTVSVLDAVPIPVEGGRPSAVLVVRVELAEGEPEVYAIPVSVTDAARGAGRPPPPEAVLALLDGPQGTESAYEASYDPAFGREVLAGLVRRRRWPGSRGDVVAVSEPEARALLAAAAATEPTALARGRGQPPIAYGDRLILRLFSDVEPGERPEAEVARVLGRRAPDLGVPTVVGALEYRLPDGSRSVFGLLETYVPNEGDAWQYTLDALGRHYERVLAPSDAAASVLVAGPGSLVAAALAPGPNPASPVLGPYASAAARIGTRLARAHAALASERDDPAFAPERFDDYYRRSVFHAMRMRADRTLVALRRRAASLPAGDRDAATRLLEQEAAVHHRLRAFLEGKGTSERIRIHGDLRLGKVLSTGQDFVLIDFGGDASRPLGERRIKRSAVRDVASLIGSFQDAAEAAVGALAARGALPDHPEARARLEAAGAAWSGWASVAFLAAYLAGTRGEDRVAPFLPWPAAELAVALDAYRLDLGFTDLEPAVEDRPADVGTPLRRLLAILAEAP